MLPIYLELAFQLFRMCTAYVGDVRRLMRSEQRELLYLRQAPWALIKLRSDRPCWAEHRIVGTNGVNSIKAIRGAIEHLVTALRDARQSHS
jgi:hypothetical protein